MRTMHVVLEARVTNGARVQKGRQKNFQRYVLIVLASSPVDVWPQILNETEDHLEACLVGLLMAMQEHNMITTTSRFAAMQSAMP